MKTSPAHSPMEAVRVGASLLLADRRARMAEGAVWTDLAAGIQGLPAAGWDRGPLGWDPNAPREGIAALSLYEHTEYLARLPPGAVWDPDLADVTSLVSPGLAGEGLWTLGFRGRAGGARLRARRHGTELFCLPVEVRTRKLDHLEDYRRMLDDLGAVRWRDALVLDSVPTTVPLATHAGRAPSAWETFVLLRHLARSGVLTAAVEAIRREPMTELRDHRRPVPWRRVGGGERVRPEDLAGIPQGSREHGRLGNVTASVIEATLDTEENRFVLGVLRALADEARRVARDPSEPHLHTASIELAETFEALGEGMFGEPLSTVEAPTPVRSTVLQRRRGYREILAAWHCLHHPTLVGGWTGETTLRAGVRDSAALYERWCTVEVARALGASNDVIARALDGHAVHLRSTLGEGVTLTSQQTFPLGGGSYSLAFRPDLVVEARGRRLLLDAKFQFERASDVLGESRGDPQGDPSGAPRLGMVKMHAYRDALAGAWGAAVLFPGVEATAPWFEAPDGGGVGALALRPGGNDTTRAAQQDALVALVRRMVAG